MLAVMRAGRRAEVTVADDGPDEPATVDPAEFARMVRTYDDRLRGLAYRLLGDRDAMDDAMQEAYVKAYRALPSFRADADLGTWLYRITYNCCIDELRRRGRRPRPSELDDRVVPVSPDGTVAVDASRDLIAALATLTPELRATVVLVDAEGLGHTEAGRILGVAPGTVASRLHRARAALRTVLEGGTA